MDAVRRPAAKRQQQAACKRDQPAALRQNTEIRHRTAKCGQYKRPAEPPGQRQQLRKQQSKQNCGRL